MAQHSRKLTAAEAAVIRAQRRREPAAPEPDSKRTVPRTLLAAGIVTIAGGAALLLWATGALEAAGLALIVVGAVVASQANRRLALLDPNRPRFGGGSGAAGTSVPGAMWVGTSDGGSGFGGGCGDGGGGHGHC